VKLPAHLVLLILLLAQLLDPRFGRLLLLLQLLVERAGLVLRESKRFPQLLVLQLGLLFASQALAF